MRALTIGLVTVINVASATAIHGVLAEVIYERKL